jgi:hypothetical protein
MTHPTTTCPRHRVPSGVSLVATSPEALIRERGAGALRWHPRSAGRPRLSRPVSLSDTARPRTRRSPSRSAPSTRRWSRSRARAPLAGDRHRAAAPNGGSAVTPMPAPEFNDGIERTVEWQDLAYKLGGGTRRELRDRSTQAATGVTDQHGTPGWVKTRRPRARTIAPSLVRNATTVRTRPPTDPAVEVAGM